MKKTALFLALTALLLVAGCSTPVSSPSMPKQHPEKYALQVIRIEGPVDDNEIQSLRDQQAAFSNNTNSSTYLFAKPIKLAPSTQAGDTGNHLLNMLGASRENIEDLLNDPNATITEFPIVYAAVGETAINDQTTPYPSPKTFEAVRDEKGNPKVVYGDEKVVGLGRFVEFTVKKVENGNVSYHVVVRETGLAGIQEYEMEPATETQDAVTASMPIFKKSGTDTELTQALGTWLPMGGMTSKTVESAHSDKEKITHKSKASFIRIIPPKGVPFKSTQPKKTQGIFVPVSELKRQAHEH